MPNKTPTNTKTTNTKLVARFRTTIDETSKSYGSKKRDYADSFGDRDYEFERYGQEIQDDFFVKNQGHGSYA